MQNNIPNLIIYSLCCWLQSIKIHPRPSLRFLQEYLHQATIHVYNYSLPNPKFLLNHFDRKKSALLDLDELSLDSQAILDQVCNRAVFQEFFIISHHYLISNIFMVPSSLPVTNHLPCDWNWIDVTFFRCPSNVDIGLGLADWISYNLISGFPAAARMRLSGDIANWLMWSESGCWMVRKHAPESASQNLIVWS